jgi:hypothetical protein
VEKPKALRGSAPRDGKGYSTFRAGKISRLVQAEDSPLASATPGLAMRSARGTGGLVINRNQAPADRPGEERKK